MALAHYDPHAIVERRNPHDPPARVWSAEERANFRESGFYKKLQEHALVVHDFQEARDAARHRSDPEFSPRDGDFDAAPIKPFDANQNYYAVLGLADMASASDVRRAWKKAVLVWHPDKIKQTGTDLTPKRARETFERISLAFEVLADGPTRRQYDRSRDESRASSEVFTWAAKKKKKKAWVPPPVHSAVMPGEAKKPKKERGEDTRVNVVVDLNDLDGGCTRKFNLRRRYPNKDKKMTSSQKEYAIRVRPGEMASKTWVFGGEGNSSLSTLAGDVRFALSVKPHSTLIRRGCHCTYDAVLTAFAGATFATLIETVAGRGVAVVGVAPDFGGATGALEIRIPDEGLPVLGMTRGERGYLAIKVRVKPPPFHGKVAKNKAAAEREWRKQEKRVERVVALKPARYARTAFGVGMKRVVISTAHAAESEGVAIAAAGISFYGEHLAAPGGPKSTRYRRFAYYFFHLCPTAFFGRRWCVLCPSLRPDAEAFAGFTDATVGRDEEDWERDARRRREARDAADDAREAATTYYRPVLAVSDDESDGDEAKDGVSGRMKRLARERKAKRREEARAAAEAEASNATSFGGGGDGATKESDDEDAPPPPPPRALPRDAVINNVSGCVVRERAALDSPRVGELAYEARVTDTGERDYSKGRQRARIRAVGLEGWISARLMRGV